LLKRIASAWSAVEPFWALMIHESPGRPVHDRRADSISGKTIHGLREHTPDCQAARFFLGSKWDGLTRQISEY
jgi:hypothetical protein